VEIILWRHAEAAPGDTDSARPLTGRGSAQAALVARWLLPRLPRELRLIASPARRAQETARALGRSFETAQGLAPGSDVTAVLRIAGWPDAGAPVMVVGHQPTLGELASRLLDGRRAPVAMGTGSVWWLRGTERRGRYETTLLLAIEPEILERGD
jgi:phosphohistidine phosphatase